MTGVEQDAASKPRRWLRQSAKWLPAALLLAVGAGYDASPPAIAADANQLKPPANGELGFVVVEFHPPFYNGGDATDCPDGMVGVMKDSYLRTLGRAEQTRLSRPENVNELDTRWKAYAQRPNGANVCSNVYEFLDRPPTPTMKGKVMWGLDLDGDAGDGSASDYTCKHQSFTSPTGERGIDFQMWRVNGCNALHRGSRSDGLGDVKFAYDNHMMSGEWTQVILLRGVDSLQDDPDVDVIYANTDDRPIADSAGKPIRDASFTVATSGRKIDSRNVLKGSIVDGVLNTQPKNILLIGGGGELDRARVRLRFFADGTVKGLLGGYASLDNVLRGARGGGRGSALTAGIDCVGQYLATIPLADGDRDPKTGQCRRISTAWEIVAIPAFVNDVPPKPQLAQH
jgi:hypothetical protein